MLNKKFIQLKENLLEKGITIDRNVPFNSLKKIIIPLSGGKDSQACLMLALKEYSNNDILCLFCDTKYEHPETYSHVNKITKKYDVDLLTINSGSVLDVCTKYKRFPGGGARHCTGELKIRPSKYFYKEFSEMQGGFQVWYGMRSDESKEREKRYLGKIDSMTYDPHEIMPRKYPKYLAKLGIKFRLPIIDWSKAEVFDLLDGEENILYYHGFDRVGCFPCLAGGEAHQMRAFDFDDTGKKHFKIAQEISKAAGRPVFITKKYINQSPGCAICSI